MQVGEAEGGVAQSISEWIKRLLAGCRPVAVAHHQLVAIFNVLNGVIERFAIRADRMQRRISAGNRVIVWTGGVLFPVAIETYWQLAFRVLLSKQHARHCRAALLSRIPRVQ